MVGTCCPSLPDLCGCYVVLSHREVTPVCKATQALGKLCHLCKGLEVILGLQPPGPLEMGTGSV